MQRERMKDLSRQMILINEIKARSRFAMFNKPKPPRKEQLYEVNKAFDELKKHLELYKQLMNRPFPDTPQPWKATEENLRKSLLDQRAFYMDIQKPLEMIDSTVSRIIK